MFSYHSLFSRALMSTKFERRFGQIIQYRVTIPFFHGHLCQQMSKNPTFELHKEMLPFPFFTGTYVNKYSFHASNLVSFSYHSLFSRALMSTRSWIRIKHRGYNVTIPFFHGHLCQLVQNFLKLELVQISYHSLFSRALMSTIC